MKTVEQQYAEYFNANVLKLPTNASFIDYVHGFIYLSIDPLHNQFYTSSIHEIITVLNSVIDGNLTHITNRRTGLCSNIHAYVCRENRRISMSILGALGSLFVKDCELFSQTDIHSYIANNPIPFLNNTYDCWSGDNLKHRELYSIWIKRHLEIMLDFPLLFLSDAITHTMKSNVSIKHNQHITKVFCYNGFLCINSSYTTKGLLNNPNNVGELGFAVEASCIHFSQEAIDTLKTIHKTNSNLGDIDCYSNTRDNDNIIFSWLGGPNKCFDLYDVNFTTSRFSDFSFLKAHNNIKIEPSFVTYIDNLLTKI